MLKTMRNILTIAIKIYFVIGKCIKMNFCKDMENKEEIF